MTLHQPLWAETESYLRATMYCSHQFLHLATSQLPSLYKYASGLTFQTLTLTIGFSSTFLMTLWPRQTWPPLSNPLTHLVPSWYPGKRFFGRELRSSFEFLFQVDKLWRSLFFSSICVKFSTLNLHQSFDILPSIDHSPNKQHYICCTGKPSHALFQDQPLNDTS